MKLLHEMTVGRTQQPKLPLENQRHDSFFSQSRTSVTISKPWWNGRKLVFLIGVACTVVAVTSLGLLMLEKNGSGSDKSSHDDNGEEGAGIKNLQDDMEKEDSILSPGNNDDQSLAVEITYDISNDCGWNSEAVMNEVGNSLKDGLIHATGLAVQSILEGFRNDDHSLRKENIFVPNDGKNNGTIQVPALVLVSIDRIVDIEDNCNAGNNCLLIISTISIAMWEGIKERLTDAIVEGISISFDDGTFIGSIPENSVVCTSDLLPKHHV